MQAIVEEQPTLLETVLHCLDSGDKTALQSHLAELWPAEIANLLESLPPPARQQLWEEVPTSVRGEVLAELHGEARSGLIDEMEQSDLVAAAQEMPTDDLAYIIEDVPQEAVTEILESMNRQDRERLETTLSYPEDTAGRLMHTDIVTVRTDASVDLVLRHLRRREALPSHTDSLMVVDKGNVYLGTLPVAKLLTGQPEQKVAELMQPEADRVQADTPVPAVATLFEQRDLISVPVVDDDGKLLGRITIDDIVGFINQESEQALMNMAGLDQEEDLFAPVLPSARRRALWLGINLMTAFLASWVIGLFEATLEKVVALAVLMPIVASMGGIAGSQTLTLVIRGMALGQVGSANARWLATKELAVGVLNGLVWALVVAVVALVWFGDWGIGVIIAVALMVNLLAAAFSGIAIPLLLQRLNIDPALSGSVILTTVTDVIGFVSFLGLGTLFLL